MSSRFKGQSTCKIWLTIIEIAEELMEIILTMVYPQLQWCLSTVVPEPAIGPSFKKETSTLYVAPHACDVEWRMKVTSHTIDITFHFNEDLDNIVKSSTAGFVQGVIIVHKIIVWICTIFQEKFTEQRSLVTNSPCKRCDYIFLPVIKSIIHFCIYVITFVSEKGYGLVLCAKSNGV